MNYEKIGILALLIALFAVSATSSIIMTSGNDNSKVNKSGDNMTGDINMSGYNVTSCGNCGMGIETDPIAMSQGFVTNATMQSDNLKYNISGGNLTGNIQMNLYKINNVSKINITTGLKEIVYSDGNEGIIMQSNSYNVFRYIAVSDTASKANYFGAFRARGTEGALSVVQKDDVLFNFYSVGYAGSWGLASPSIRMRANGTFNSTSTPTYISYMTTDSSKVDHYITQTSEGNLKIDALTSTGNHYTCLDANGQLYKCAGEITPSGNITLKTPKSCITMYSPNGSPFRLEVNNLGTLTTLAGTCS